MKNLSTLFCLTLSLGMNTAEASAPAARALAHAFLNPVRFTHNPRLSAYKRDIHEKIFIAMEGQGLNFSRTEEGLEARLEVLMEEDSLLKNLADNIAKNPHPERFVDSQDDFNILAKLLARASGEKDPALSERLTEIRSATREEVIERFAWMSHAQEKPSPYSYYFFLQKKKWLTNFKWREYLFESP